MINEFGDFIYKNENFDLLIFGEGEDRQKIRRNNQ